VEMDAAGTSFRVAADLFEERRCHCGLRVGGYGNRDLGCRSIGWTRIGIPSARGRRVRPGRSRSHNYLGCNPLRKFLTLPAVCGMDLAAMQTMQTNAECPECFRGCARPLGV